MFCPPRSDGGSLMTGARPAGVCPHGRQLYYCIACGGKGWCREHRRWRATCVQCGPPLATALCALHPAQRRNRCPCRRRQSVPDPLCGALLTPGSYAWTFTATERSWALSLPRVHRALWTGAAAPTVAAGWAGAAGAAGAARSAGAHATVAAGAHAVGGAPTGAQQDDAHSDAAHRPRPCKLLAVQEQSLLQRGFIGIACRERWQPCTEFHRTVAMRGNAAVLQRARTRARECGLDAQPHRQAMQSGLLPQA